MSKNCPPNVTIYSTLCRHEQAEERFGGRRPGLPLHIPFAVRVRHTLQKIRRARRIREGVLRHLGRGDTVGRQFRQDMRTQFASAELEDTAELRPQALRRVRRAAEPREAPPEEDKEQRELQGGRAQRHNRESARDGGQVRSSVRHDYTEQRHGPGVQSASHGDKFSRERAAVGAGFLGSVTRTFRYSSLERD